MTARKGILGKMRGDATIRRSELAFEFSEIFRELDSEELEEVIEKNVPVETLDFFRSYAPCPTIREQNSRW